MDKILLAVSTGRSGTVSLTQLIQDIFNHNHHKGYVYHERDSNELCNLFANYHESVESINWEKAKAHIKSWEPGCAIIGFGYAPFLELIHEIHGKNILLIELQRERESCLLSLAQNLKLIPNRPYYYPGIGDKEKVTPTGQMPI